MEHTDSFTVTIKTLPGFAQTTGPELETYDARFQPQMGKPELSLLFPVQPQP